MIPQIIRAASKLSKFIPKASKVVPKIRSSIANTATKTSRGIKDAVIRSRSHKIIGSTAARTRVIQNVDKYYLKEINRLKNTYKETSKLSSKIIKGAKESLKTMPSGGSAVTRQKITAGIKEQLKDIIKRTAKSGAPARAQLRTLIRERRVANQFLKRNYKDIVKDTVNRTRILRNRASRNILNELNASGLYQTPSQLKTELMALTRLNSKGQMVPELSKNIINKIIKANPKGRILMNNEATFFKGISTGLHEVKHSVQNNLSKALQKRLHQANLHNLPPFARNMKDLSRPVSFMSTRGNPIYQSIDDIIYRAGNLTTRHARPNSAVMQLAKRLQNQGIIPRHLNANTLNYKDLSNAMINVRGKFANPSSKLYKGPGTFKKLFPGGEKQFAKIKSDIFKMLEKRKGDIQDIPGYFRTNYEISTRLDEVRNVPGLINKVKNAINSGAKGDKVLMELRKKHRFLNQLLDVMPRTQLRKALDNAWMGIPGLPMLDYLNEDK